MNIISIKDTPEYILGALNSRLVSFWFVHKFGKMQRGTFPQFKVNELKTFPLPKKQNPQVKARIIELVKTILEVKEANPDADITELDKQVDELVYQAYELTENDIALIEGSFTDET